MAQNYLDEFELAVARNRLKWEKQQDPEANYHFTVPDITVKSLYNYWAQIQPDKPRIIYEEKVYTYKQCNSIAQRIANGIKKMGYEKGERLINFLHNTPELMLIGQACFKLGIIIVNCNPCDTPREYANKLRDSGAKIAVVDDNSINVLKEAGALLEEPIEHVILFANDNSNGQHFIDGKPVTNFQLLIAESEETEPDVEVLPSDIQVMQYTGGTTGVLKACCLTNRALVANAMATYNQMATAIKANELSIIIQVPMSHGMGFNTAMMLPMLAGGTTILLDIRKFSLNYLLEVISKTRPTLWPIVPSVMKGLVDKCLLLEYDISSVKVVNSGGAPLPLEVIKKFEGLTKAKIIESYGLSEACTSVLIQPFNNKKQGTVGIPYPNTDVLIVDIASGTKVVAPGELGEIIFRGPQMMECYWNKPADTEVTIRNGWIYTGDIGVMDEDGVFRIVDRIKDVIIVSGLNVYPREVDEVLIEHPDITDACTVGIRDERRGEIPISFVVKRSGSEISDEEILEYCGEKLSRYKVPRKIEFIDTIPKTKNNKPDKKALVRIQSSVR